MADAFDKPTLLSKVRALMARDELTKRKWCGFCDLHQAGAYLPEKQDEAFLMTFLEAVDGEAVPIFEGELPREVGGGKSAGGKGGWVAGGKGGYGGDAGYGGGKDSGKGSPGSVFVGGLLRSATEPSVMNFLGQYGRVSSVTVKYNEDGSCKGFAFGVFEDPSAADRLVAASNAGATVIDGKVVNCEKVTGKGGNSKGDKGGCKGKDSWGGGSWDSGKNNYSKGGGWGKGDDMKGNGKGFVGGGGGGGGGGGVVAPPPPPPSPSASGAPHPGKVFVGGLPKDTPEERVRQFASQYGMVSSVLMKYSEAGQPRGFCFVEFTDPQSARRLISDSKAGTTIFDGKWIDCKDPTAKGSEKGGFDKGKGKGDGWDKGGWGGPDPKRQRTDGWGGGGGWGGDKGGTKGGFGKGGPGY